MPITVACHVRNGGSWKKTAPWAKSVGGWVDQERSYAMDSSVWQTCWVDPLRSLTLSGAINRVSFDFSSPYDAGAGQRYNVNGTSSFYDKPGTPSFVSAGSWLKYDVGTFAGRNYDFNIKFVDQGSHNLDTVPTLNTELATASGPYEFSSDTTIVDNEVGHFTVSFYDNDAPGPAPVLHSYLLTIDVEAQDLS